MVGAAALEQRIYTNPTNRQALESPGVNAYGDHSHGFKHTWRLILQGDRLCHSLKSAVLLFKPLSEETMKARERMQVS